MKKLTEDQKVKITMDMLNEQPLETIGKTALIKIAQMAIPMNSEQTTLSMESTIDGRRYELKMVVTYREIEL